jgi:hypothetical protein
MIQECDQIVSALLHRQMSYASDRPQDYVVAVLLVRAFRITISSLHLALSGYPDSSPALDRSVFEIALRLLDLNTAPQAASLGFLIQGATEEIATVEAELDSRKQTGLSTGNLQENLQRMGEYVQSLKKLCRTKGIDPEQAQKRHGRLNFRQVARDFGIENAYLVGYAWASSYVHEKNVAASVYYSATPERHNFALGPIPGEAVHAAVPDSVKYLTTVFEVASEILDDKELAHRSERLSAAYAEKLTRLM